MTAQITHHNPAGLPRNPAFSQAVSVEGPTRTIYVGGQNAVDADGTVASHDPAAQTAQALQNLELVLADAGARLEDVASWSVLVVAGQPLSEAFAGFQQVGALAASRQRSPSRSWLVWPTPSSWSRSVPWRSCRREPDPAGLAQQVIQPADSGQAKHGQRP